MSKFISLAEMVPDFARTDHDDLYKAIDIYLKINDSFDIGDRFGPICDIIRKAHPISPSGIGRSYVESSTVGSYRWNHAYTRQKNEKSPLMVVVQVLFFEHARVTKTGDEASHLPDDLKGLLSRDLSRPREPLTTVPTSIPAEDQFCVSAKRTPPLKVKLAEDEEQDVQHSDTGKVESGEGVDEDEKVLRNPGTTGEDVGQVLVQ